MRLSIRSYRRTRTEHMKHWNLTKISRFEAIRAPIEARELEMRKNGALRSGYLFWSGKTDRVFYCSI
jgi:hypothetical protein